MAPYDIIAAVGGVGEFFVYIALGFAFGYILESAGFGDSRVLAGQFYFTDLTVLKTMFTSIIVAAILVGFSVGAGLLDYGQIWVNPTFLVPVITGGLIMGVGFVIGGYCPGTSLVSLATLKLDGLFFVLGGLVGIGIFGEVADSITVFWTSTDMGRFTVQELFGISHGMAVLMAALLAVTLYVGAEAIKAAMWGGKLEIKMKSVWAGSALILAALVVALMGDLTIDDRWEKLAHKYQPKLDSREVYIDPAEIVKLRGDDAVYLKIVDLREERDWNLFHLYDAEHMNIQQVIANYKELAALSGNTALIFVSNDEELATNAWKKTMAQGGANAYILEGGINHWIEVYGEHLHQFEAKTEAKGDMDYRLPLAYGLHHEAANPDPHHDTHREFESKVKLVKKVRKSGGCG